MPVTWKALFPVLSTPSALSGQLAQHYLSGPLAPTPFTSLTSGTFLARSLDSYLHLYRLSFSSKVFLAGTLATWPHLYALCLGVT